MNESKPDKEIKFTIPDTCYVIGDSIPLTITYINNSSGVIVFKQPEKVTEVGVSVTPKNKQPQGARFGRVIEKVVDEITTRRVVEKAEKITLKPGATYEFKEDIAARFPDILPPGNLIVQVFDKTSNEFTILSNSIDVTINFTIESIPKLMNIISGSGNESFRRRWAVDWLRKFKADFQPKIPLDDDTAEVKAEMESQVARELEKFRDWWATAQYSEQIKLQVKKMNAQYFIEEKPIQQNENR